MLRTIWQRSRRKILPYLLLGAFGTAFLLLGTSIGLVVEKYQEYRRAEAIEPFPENIPREIPLLFLEKIENGVLYGRNEGAEIRFIVGAQKEAIFPEDSGAFQFSVAEILPMLRRLPAPAGTNFVASSRGTKFWPLDAPEAFLIVPKNRTFFATKEAAVQSGYSAGK